MTRFTMLALALLVAAPAGAEPAQPIIRPQPWATHEGTCLQLTCFAVKHLRDAYRRGEIKGVELNTRRECNALNFDVDVYVPCTVLYPDMK